LWPYKNTRKNEQSECDCERPSTKGDSLSSEGVAFVIKLALSIFIFYYINLKWFA